MSTHATAEQREAVFEQYRDGLAIEDIITTSGYSKGTIYRWLAAADVPRDRWSAERLGLQLPAEVLTRAWTTSEAGAWACGLIVSGGTLTDRRLYQRHNGRDSPDLCLRLQWRDRDGVEAFAAAFGIPTSRVRREDNRRLQAKHGKRGGLNAAVRLSHTRLWFLVEELGMPLGRKYEIAALPESLASNRHAWRGVIDGDGYTSLLQQGGKLRALHLGLRGKSHRLHAQFGDFVETHVGVRPYFYDYANESAPKSVVTGEDAVRIIHVLYDNCEYTIARKRTKALALARERIAPTLPAPVSSLGKTILEMLGDPMTSAEIATRLGLSATKGDVKTVSSCINGLVRRGLVEATHELINHQARRWRRTSFASDSPA